MFLATATVLLAAGASFAQTSPDEFEPGSGQGAAGPSTGAWPVYPRERHLLLRAEVTTAARLSDPFAAGTLAPTTLFVQGSYAALHLGEFLLGPSFGTQVGFDHTGVQVAFQPGATLYRRFSPGLAFHARFDIPILLTRGACGQSPESPLMIPTNRTEWYGNGIERNRMVAPAPATGFCGTLAFGVEAAVGGALYLTSGIALTGEAIFDMYFGNGAVQYPLLGAGLGVLVDYEVLP